MDKPLYEQAIKFTHLVYSFDPNLPLNRELVDLPNKCKGCIIKTFPQENDVFNILVLQNWLERIRKEVINKALSIKRISEFLNFPILAQPTLKKI